MAKLNLTKEQKAFMFLISKESLTLTSLPSGNMQGLINLLWNKKLIIIEPKSATASCIRPSVIGKSWLETHSDGLGKWRKQQKINSAAD